MGRLTIIAGSWAMALRCVQQLRDTHGTQTPLTCFCPYSCSSRACLGKNTNHAAAQSSQTPLCQHPNSFTFCYTAPQNLKKKQCHFPLTSQAAAIGWIYFSAIYFESPAPGDINVGRFFNIDYVWGSGARNAKKVGDISTIEASLKQRKSKFHHISLLWESDAAFPHSSVPRNNL